MKKLLLFILLFFAFGANMAAQNFYAGLILGGVASQVGGDARGGFNKVGVVGGGYAGIFLTEDIDIQMEIKYIQKGSYSADFENYPVYDPFLIKLDYIDFPVVLSYNLNKINVNDINLSWLKLELGLGFDYLINYRQKIQGIIVPASNPWRKVVLNTVVGFRVNIKEGLDIGLRFVNSMTSICETSKWQYSNGNVTFVKRLFNNYGMYNDVMQLSLFWNIKGSKSTSRHAFGDE